MQQIKKISFSVLTIICLITIAIATHECPKGRYGPRCAGKCDCKQGATCMDGRAGVGRCVCSEGTYGADCSGTCNCKHQAFCNDGTNGNGNCICTNGYMGQNCGLSINPTTRPSPSFNNNNWEEEEETTITLLTHSIIEESNRKEIFTNQDHPSTFTETSDSSSSDKNLHFGSIIIFVLWTCGIVSLIGIVVIGSLLVVKNKLRQRSNRSYQRQQDNEYGDGSAKELHCPSYSSNKIQVVQPGPFDKDRRQIIQMTRADFNYCGIDKIYKEDMDGNTCVISTNSRFMDDEQA